MSALPFAAYAWRLYVGLASDAHPDWTPETIEAAARATLDRLAPDGYTVARTEGCWAGAREPSLVVDIVGREWSLGDTLARALAGACAQGAVLLVRSSVVAEFVAAESPPPGPREWRGESGVLGAPGCRPGAVE